MRERALGTASQPRHEVYVSGPPATPSVIRERAAGEAATPRPSIIRERVAGNREPTSAFVLRKPTSLATKKRSRTDRDNLQIYASGSQATASQPRHQVYASGPQATASQLRLQIYASEPQATASQPRHENDDRERAAGLLEPATPSSFENLDENFPEILVLCF